MLAGHQKQWEFLKKKYELNQLSHAYLFTGEEQLGKRTFAKEFAKLLNCKSEQKPCQKCFACQAIEKGAYPDLMNLAPDEGKEIPILKVRQVQNFLSYKSYYGSFKLVIVDDAEKMNTEAQSCFLKTLEEPKGKTILMLVSSKPEMILPTIYSRCQNIKFFQVPQDETSKFLQQQGAKAESAKEIAKMAQGRPGRAQEIFLNPEKIKQEQELLSKLLKVIDSDLAEKFRFAKEANLEGDGFFKILEALERHFRNLLFESMEAKPKKYTVPKIKEAIKLIQDISFQALFTNASPKLALEILLMEI